MSAAAAERMISPMAMNLFKYYYDTDDEIRNLALRFLFIMLKDNEESSPHKVIVLYIEIYKATIVRKDNEFSEKMLEKIFTVLPTVQRETTSFRCTLFLEQIFCTYENTTIDDAFLKLINDQAVGMESIRKKTAIRCNAAIIVYNRNKDLDFVKNKLKETLTIIMDEYKFSIGDKLHSLYYLLDTTLYFLDSNVDLTEEWMVDLLTSISHLHHKILGTGKKIDEVVTVYGKKYYLSLAKYIQKKGYISDD